MMKSTEGERSRSVRCAQPGCVCAVGESDATIEHGQRFCSSGCAAGEGCSHSDCECLSETPIRND
jgi:hypothetical protein